MSPGSSEGRCAQCNQSWCPSHAAACLAEQLQPLLHQALQVALAVSELTSNLAVHARSGDIQPEVLAQLRTGLDVLARIQAPHRAGPSHDVQDVLLQVLRTMNGVLLRAEQDAQASLAVRRPPVRQ